MNQSILYIIAVVVVLTIGLALYFYTRSSFLALYYPPAFVPAPVPAQSSTPVPAPIPTIVRDPVIYPIPLPAQLASSPDSVLRFTIVGDYTGTPRTLTRMYDLNDRTAVAALADGDFYKLSVVGNSGIAKGLSQDTSYYLNYPNAATSPEPIFRDFSNFDKFKDSSSLGKATPIGNYYKTRCTNTNYDVIKYCAM